MCIRDRVYSGDIVLSITGDKIDSGKLAQLAERSIEELKQFKHVEAPKEINLAVLRALFELFDLPSGLAQKASQGDTEPVIKLQEKVSGLVPRVLKEMCIRDRAWAAAPRPDRGRA